MHRFVGATATFHYNSDLSGEVVIIVAGAEVSVPFTDIADFVAAVANHG